MSYVAYEVRVYDNGSKAWYLNGKSMMKEEHRKQTQCLNGKIVEIEGKQYKMMEV